WGCSTGCAAGAAHARAAPGATDAAGPSTAARSAATWRTWSSSSPRVAAWRATSNRGRRSPRRPSCWWRPTVSGRGGASPVPTSPASSPATCPS
ncbi:MAG: Putative oxidoreductase, partial [uncultured Nocardioidaceae bacterium]